MWGLSVLGGSLLYMLDEKGFFHLEHFIYVVGVLSTFCSCDLFVLEIVCSHSENFCVVFFMGHVKL